MAEGMLVHGVKLEIPAFTRGKKRLSQREVELSHQLSKAKIDVERVIGLMKKKYTILKGPIPTTQLKHSDNVGISNIDKILFVCAALTNSA